MFPIGDERVQGGPPPVVTLGLIALNVLAFLVELAQPSEGALQSFIQAWGVVPREYAAAQDLPPTIPLPFWSTLLTSMFLHGGWMHLGGNMLYLWIFGDNLEKVMGARLPGLLPGLRHRGGGRAHRLQPRLQHPDVGASGAISGVLGGYLVLFPHNRVRVLTRGGIAQVPAIVVLGFWIVIQLISGVGRWRDDHRDRRRGLHGPHRRLRRRTGAREADGGAEEARRGLTLRALFESA